MKKNRSVTGKGIELPPLRLHVAIYFMQKGMTEKAADFFYDRYAAVDWKFADGRPVKNWKTLACDWIWELQHAP